MATNSVIGVFLTSLDVLVVFGFGSVLLTFAVGGIEVFFAAFGAFSAMFLGECFPVLSGFFDVFFAVLSAFLAVFGAFFAIFFGDFFAERAETGAFLTFFVGTFVFPEAFLPLAGFDFEDLAGFPARRDWRPAMHAGLNERGEIRQEV